MTSSPRAIGENQNSSAFWPSIVFLLMAMVIFAFSSDLRVGLNFQLDARPDFQFFELICIFFAAPLVLASPWMILQARVELKGEDWLLVFFLFNATILALFADDVLHNISRTKDFFWAFSLYALLRYGPLNRRALDVLVRLSVLTAFGWALFGIIQWLGWDEGLGQEPYKLFLASQALYKTVVDPFAGEVVQARFAHGIYLYPQNFIYYLLCPFFLSLGLASRDRRWLFASAIIFAAMLGTLSKAFLLLLLIFSSIWGLQQVFRNAVIGFAAFAALTGAAVLAVVLFGHYPFWEQALATFVWRLEIWADTWPMLRDNPWLLVAGDGTALLASTYSRVGYPNPHNMFIYMLIEYGIFGAGLFFSFLFLRFRSFREGLSGAASSRPEAQTLCWGLVIFISMGLVDDMFVQTQITALIFFYLGLATRLLEWGAHHQNGRAAEVGTEIGGAA